MNFIRSIATSLLLLCFVTPAFAEDNAKPAEEQKNKKPQAKAPKEQAVQVNSAALANFRNRGWTIPIHADIADKTERLLLLLPGGPLVIDISITLDGNPFRVHRETMIDVMFESADKNKDEKITWEELFKSPMFAAGNYATAVRDEATKKRTIGQYDVNKNGQVDRFEARLITATYSGGTAFSLLNYNYGRTANTPVRSLLDADKNGTLSKKELAMAESRLKSRDSDDNDIVEISELTGTSTRYGYGRTTRTPAILYHLGDSTNFATLFAALKSKYTKKDKLPSSIFRLNPKLAKLLDDNGDGSIDQKETARLLDITPCVRLEANLGDRGEAKMIRLLGVGEDIKIDDHAASTVGGKVFLKLPTTTLEMVVSNTNAMRKNYLTSANSMLTRFDKDKNKYIDKKEIGDQANLKRQFALWDVNDDGKVYADEIIKSYERSYAPTMNRVSVGAVDRGNSLFASLDISGDGRLSLREMRVAAENLKSTDKNNDGQITLDEIPSTVRLAIARGNYAYQALYPQRGRTSGNRTPPNKQAAPDWFVRMDRNGDGDVTEREFLGTPEQFKRIDKNKDGFIEPKEAKSLDK